jgi:hypothetical protein
MAPSESPDKKQATTKVEAPAETITATATTKKTSGLAVAALILAFFIPVVGLVLGIIALSSIKKNGESGKGLATAAIILSTIFMLTYVLVIAGFVMAFQKAAKDSGVNVNPTNGSVSVTGKDGQSASFGKNVSIPSGFPSDVPIYEPSDVIAAAKVKEGYAVSLLTKDSVDKVSAYYQKELKAKGWVSGDSNGEFNFNGGSVSTFEKGSNTLGVIIASDTKTNNSTSITLTTGPKVSSTDE